MRRLTMGRLWLSLSLLSLLAVCLHAMPWDDGVRPRNVTVQPSTRSVDVHWKPPSRNQSALESYRVRIYAARQPDRKRVQWVPVETHPHEVISCLEPNTEYRVQVFTRFYQNSNISDANSDVVKVFTHPETPVTFVDRLWQQRVSVLIGAIAMLVLVLIFTPCICFCLVRKRRQRGQHWDRMDRDRKNGKTSKDTSLPSATELQSRERAYDTSNDDSRYTVEPVQGLAFRTRPPMDSPPMDSPTNRRDPFAISPPPSYSQTTNRTPSMPLEPAPGLPPMSLPMSDGFDSDHDIDDYQNDLYSNQTFAPPRPPRPGDDLYGNVQY
ncbi:uncharacterized protein LOC143290223 isoform X2 [Babylonia areolata]|uniref:uncharacterized protein LOC143290223 isoform X2 n=1 Tax=Babylonia areolata TaxID=304850 RepID=UPI003FD44690